MKNIGHVCIAASLSASEAIMAPAVLSKFACAADRSESSMCVTLCGSPHVLDYFVEVVRKVAASPEGKAAAADFFANRV